MIEKYVIPHLGGGIRNDVISQLIEPFEAWDSLNEDSSRFIGASAKRKGGIRVTSSSLGGAVRCIWEGKAWEKKRIVVAGGKVYDFDPPSTFTEIYDGFDGEKHDFVRVEVFMDDAYGGIFVLMDGVNHPLYWDGIGAPTELSPYAPIAKYGASFKGYFIMANITESDLTLRDGEDIEIGTVAADTFSGVQELSVPWTSGTIKGIIVENPGTNPDIDLHIFSTKPIGWVGGGTANQDPMNRTGHVFSQATINAAGWRDLDLDVDFYTGNRTLYFAIFNDSASSADDVKVRILYSTTHYNQEEMIKWCPPNNIREWRTADEEGTLTAAGTLLLHTRGHGSIINILPITRDVCLVYKDDGAIVALRTTGSATAPLAFSIVAEGHKLVAGNAIIPWGGYHWALTEQGFLRIDASNATPVSPYGKAKKIFDTLSDRWGDSYGTVLEQENKIVISYPRSGAEDKDGAIVYNPLRGTYDKWDTEQNVFGVCESDDVSTIDAFSGILIGDLAGMQIDDARLKMTIRELYGGGYNGHVSRYGWGDRDYESGINAYRRSGWIVPSAEKPEYAGKKYWFRFVTLEVDVTRDSTLVLKYITDYESDWTTMPSITLSAGGRSLVTLLVKRGLNKTGRAIKLEWSNSAINESYVVRSVTIGYELVGGR